MPRTLRAPALALAALLAALLAACSDPDPADASLSALAARPDVLPLPDGFRPEGVATGRGGELFAGSLADGSVVRIDLRTGELSELVPPQGGPIAVGMSHDDRSDLLWIAGGGAGFAGDGSGNVYDAATGATVASYAFGGGFVNDVIVTRDAAWFTDSFAPVLYKVPLGPAGQPSAGFEVVPLGGDFVFVPATFNSNGIEATPDGSALLLINSATGTLYTVDPTTGTASAVDLGGPLPSGDGLLLDGPTLYVVQNAIDTIAAVRLSPDLASGAVVATITDPLFDIPTTVAGFGSSLYAVNARFNQVPDPTTASYDVIRVRKVPARP